MNHPKPEEWVQYVFGEASSASHRRLQEHLRECGECRQEIEAWQRSRGCLNAWKLPRMQRRPEALAPLLRWAVATSFILMLGFGLGWLTSVRNSNAGFQNALDRAQSQTAHSLAALEARLAKTSGAETRQLVQGLTVMLERAREEDRRAALALFRDLEKQHVAAYVALRKDLERLASLTEDEIRQARLTLVQLVDQTPTNEGETTKQ